MQLANPGLRYEGPAGRRVGMGAQATSPWHDSHACTSVILMAYQQLELPAMLSHNVNRALDGSSPHQPAAASRRAPTAATPAAPPGRPAPAAKTPPAPPPRSGRPGPGAPPPWPAGIPVGRQTGASLLWAGLHLMHAKKQHRMLHAAHATTTLDSCARD